MKKKTFLVALLAMPLLWPGTSAAWPGFNWDEWHAATGVEKPEIESAQAGLPELLPLLKNSPDDPRPFRTVTSWARRRDEVKRTLMLLMGTPGQMAIDPDPTTELGEDQLEDYRRIHVRIQGELDDPIFAYVLVPNRPMSRLSPAMVVLHQTQAAGKAEACGMTGDPEMAFADELAKRGYICIAPDAAGFGERIPEGGQPYDGAMEFYKKHPTWSYFGKMNWDLGRVIEYLRTRGDVDMERIGAIGHSHGAYGAIMASVFEPRIALTVASCGFTTLRADPSPERWSHLTPLLPRLGFYVDDIKQAPFDWHQVIACIAPRHFFNWSTLDDDIFPNTANLAGVYTQLDDLYKLFLMDGRFHGELVPGKHQFPKEGREMAYTWIDQHFKAEGK